MTYNPYEALRAQPWLTAVWDAHVPEMGRWYQRLHTMLIHKDQTQAERRCTVTHELVHAERGDTSCDPSVHREAARRLIDIHALAEAMAYYGDDLHQVAEELWVDDETLAVRLQSLHPSERGYLKRRLSMCEETA